LRFEKNLKLFVILNLFQDQFLCHPEFISGSTDSPYSILDTGYWMLDAGYLIPDAETSSA
jgi:hypothetical protein